MVNNMNMQALMRQAQNLQKEMMKAQEEVEKEVFSGSSSLVKVEINGKKEVISIKINADASLDKEDLEALEDMLLLAINEAMKKAEEFKEKKMSKFSNMPGIF